MPTNVWYKDGLNFECAMCGNCCTGCGCVPVTKEEIEAMAKHMAITVDEFTKLYINPKNPSILADKTLYGDCILLEDKTNKCLVYGAMPKQCASWPWLDFFINSPEAWAGYCKDTGGGKPCPGTAANKRLVPLTEIDSALTASGTKH